MSVLVITPQYIVVSAIHPCAERRELWRVIGQKRAKTLFGNSPVIPVKLAPAKAGNANPGPLKNPYYWIPSSAGMTERREVRKSYSGIYRSS
ncbi:MAG TPA: hypothetical protein DEP25_00805 [Candidatus Taylorbacteria bacterium]|nr:hypothetical protein [Candidatus Taylorbacteria bacterium]